MQDDDVEAEEEDEQGAATHRNLPRIILIATFRASNNRNVHRLVEARRAVVLENVVMTDAVATGMVVEAQVAVRVLGPRRRRKNLMRRWMTIGATPLLLLRVVLSKTLFLRLRL